MDLVRSDWRHSYRLSPRTAKWPQEAYAIWVADHMAKLLPRCRVVVARPPDWSSGVLGWVAAEQLPERFVLHYTFVRPLFRQQGVMTALIKSLEPKGELVFSSLRPPYSNALKALGFAHDKRAAS